MDNQLNKLLLGIFFTETSISNHYEDTKCLLELVLTCRWNIIFLFKRLKSENPTGGEKHRKQKMDCKKNYTKQKKTKLAGGKKYRRTKELEGGKNRKTKTRQEKSEKNN